LARPGQRLRESGAQGIKHHRRDIIEIALDFRPSLNDEWPDGLQDRQQHQHELTGYPHRGDQFRSRRNGVRIGLGLRVGAARADQGLTRIGHELLLPS